jgi:Spy/CpxP family protein refolding chaperone
MFVVLSIVLLVAGAAAWAQQPPGPSGPSGPVPPGGVPQRQGQPGPQMDPMADLLFPPDLVMQNSRIIGLTEPQETAIRGELQKAQSRFVDLQWDLHKEQQAFQDLLKADKPDEKQVLAQLDKVLAVEKEIKKTQTGLMVRIKNVLNPEQQAQLRELRRRAMGRMGPPGPMSPGGPRQPGEPPRPPGPPPGEATE